MEPITTSKVVVPSLLRSDTEARKVGATLGRTEGVAVLKFHFTLFTSREFVVTLSMTPIFFDSEMRIFEKFPEEMLSSIDLMRNLAVSEAFCEWNDLTVTTLTS